ncbi:MAG: hypothetical protein ACQEUD_07315 [Bacillota bacterium]
MKEKFKKIFLKSKTIIDWLESPGVFDMKKAGNILVVVFIIIGSILVKFNGVSTLLNNILLGLLIITMFSLFFILSLNSFWIKPLRFIRQGTDNPAQLFDRFSHRSYLYGIIVYSFFTSILIGGIILGIVHFIPESNFNLSKWFYNLFFLTSSIFTVLYFMFHVSVKEIPTKVVKARIRLYLAVITTITAGLFGLSLKEILFPLITYLGIGLAWLSFFVEKIESEA